MNGLAVFIFELAVLIFSVMLHEISHGYAAERLGDPTARLAGRLTLNPLKHIDLFGSIIFPLLLSLAHLPVLAWAKPVPYNPNNLYKDYKYGPLKVALAGPFSNIFIFAVFGLLARGTETLGQQTLAVLFGAISLLNIFLALFNLVPIPPLDGSKILFLFLPREYAIRLEQMGILAGIFFVLLFVYFFAALIFQLSLFLMTLVAGSGTTIQILQFL